MDKEDYERLSKYSWSLHGNGYAVAWEPKIQALILMHQLLCSSDMDIDHINRNKLDNRRSNLRCASRTLNNYNRVGVKGVKTRQLSNGEYRFDARINYLGQRIHLGTFSSLEEAEEARRNGLAYYIALELDRIRPATPGEEDDQTT